MNDKKQIKNGLIWNLDDILKVEEFDNLSQKIEKYIEVMGEKIKTLSPEMDMSVFGEIMKLEEENNNNLSKLLYLPHLRESIDQKDSEAKLLQSKAENLYLKSEDVSRKLFHWIKGKPILNLPILDEKNAKRLFNSVPDLKFQLEHQRKAAQYSLEDKEENIINYKTLFGISALKDLRRIIETEFKYKLKGQKTKIIKTQSELMSLVYDPHSTVRKAAYESLLKTHKKNLDKFFLIYQSVIKDWNYECSLRGYKSPISIRNFGNNISDKAVETLLSVCSQNKNIFQDFFKYKAKILKVSHLERFDIYAPATKVNKELEFNEALNLVLKTFKNFSNNFYVSAKKIIDEQHLDSHPRINKRSGAFCATVNPQITPYVMANYTKQMRDAFTLAHELGHGIHSLLANKHTYSSQSSGLPLAETASTLGELILFEEIYKQETNVAVKKNMLMEKIADAYATILRQNYFVKFEIEAHKRVVSGMTAEELSDIYMENLKEQFGDSVIIDPLFKYEWAYIPHIVDSPFYCYAYNFGELLSYSLFQNYKKEGKAYINKIEEILRYGGSEDPQMILNNVGINIEEKKFWQDSFEIIKNWQKELENLS